MSDPVRIYPPGPFPPIGEEQPGTIDLGVRLREALFRRDLIAGPVRGSLAHRLSDLSNSPQSLLMGLHLIEPFLDTWPLAAMVDGARQAWADGPDGPALAVLERAASVVSAAIGWPRLDRRWPLPDEAWMRAQLEDDEYEVVSRGPMDGAPSVAAALSIPWGRSDPIELPPFAEVAADELVDQRDELLARVERGEITAVRVTTPAGTDDATVAALRAIREAAPAQRTFERYGLAGLLVPGAPWWDDLLDIAPAGTPGQVLQPSCHAVLMNRLDDQMQIEPVAALVWDAPYRPMMVLPAAAAVLRLVDGESDTASIASALSWPRHQVARILEELVSVGACTV